MSTNLKIEQRHRDAAADYLKSIAYAYERHVSELRKGKHDGSAEVQAFAKFEADTLAGLTRERDSARSLASRYFNEAADAQESLSKAEADLARAIGVVRKYGDDFCEGLCDGGPHFGFDCSGCPAKALLNDMEGRVDG